MMIEIALLVLLFINVILFLLIRKQRKDFLAANRITLKAMDEMVTTLVNVISTVGEHQKVFSSQQQLNEVFVKHFEVLGIHTKLIKPSVGYEAEAYLAWYNKKKEEKDNG